MLAFYDLYRDVSLEPRTKNLKPTNVLDQWILSRLNELISLTTKSLDNYKLLEPTRGIRDFINDLSTWYLRRSRERIKNGDKEAKMTLYFVLKTLAKVIAPFAPFAAEDIWFKLRNEKDEESVHLCEWPHSAKASRGAAQVLENMKQVRGIVTMGLEARQKAGIPVRQPLASLKLKVESGKLKAEYLELIKEELNVKEVIVGDEFSLDTNITPALRAEGEYREFMRGLQDRRKKLGLKPGDKMPLTILEIYKKYKIYPRLQAHMLRVSAVASLICDNFSKPINKGDIVLAALFHDMGNIIKAKNVNFFGDFDDKEANHWEKVKQEFIRRYGADETNASVKIMREIGLSASVISLANKNQFSLLCENKESRNVNRKIIQYSDYRAAPDGVVSYFERMEEAQVRYQEENRGREEERQRLVNCGAEIEKQIFAHCKIKPEDITDKSVAPIIEELKNFVIE